MTSTAKEEHGSSAVRGSCMCGGMVFEVSGRRSDIAFCHCSLCRKVSGVGSNATITVDFDGMKWISGEHLVTVWPAPLRLHRAPLSRVRVPGA